MCLFFLHPFVYKGTIDFWLIDWLTLCPSPLSSCFLSLLLVAAVVWKIKQTCWASRRREVGRVYVLRMLCVRWRAICVNVRTAYARLFTAHGELPSCVCVCVFHSATHKLLDAAATQKTTVNIHWRIPPTRCYEGWVNVTSLERKKKKRSLRLTSIASKINKAIPLN